MVAAIGDRVSESGRGNVDRKSTGGTGLELMGGGMVLPGGSQVSVPLTVTPVVPCVMFDEERELLKVHAGIGCVLVVTACVVVWPAGPTVNVVLITLLLGFGSLSVEIDQVRV